jgi:hypothetical protein
VRLWRRRALQAAEKRTRRRVAKFRAVRVARLHADVFMRTCGPLGRAIRMLRPCTTPLTNFRSSPLDFRRQNDTGHRAL